jgi:AcrR family transcriptional regulator
VTERLSRAESQALTRRRLVDTARQMFLRDGYAATSLEKVAEEAGYSKGAVYSNFAGKDALCLAVLDTIHAEVAEAVLGSLEGAATVEDALHSFDLWAEARLGDPDWSALEAEFAARSRRDPRFRDALAERNRRLREMIAGALERSCRDHGLTLSTGVEAAASALLSLGIGLGLQRSLNPQLPVHVLSDVVRVLVGLPLTANRGNAPHSPERGPTS